MVPAQSRARAGVPACPTMHLPSKHKLLLFQRAATPSQSKPSLDQFVTTEWTTLAFLTSSFLPHSQTTKEGASFNYTLTITHQSQCTASPLQSP